MSNTAQTALKRNRLQAAIAGAIAACAAAPASNLTAQDALEEILVTATRRATNVQDVPLAVTAITGESLRMQNFENLEDLTSTVPNVLVRGGAGQTGAAINMRGIPGVGVYIDGIWQVSGAGLLQRPFIELDRVEVLRGPQGTLYGRDSTGGSIHIYSKLPAPEFGGVVDLGIGEFNRRDVSASFDLPIAENFRTKWSLGNYSRDGYLPSRVNGVKAGALDDQLVRGDLYWTPTDRFSARLSHQEDELVMTDGKVINFIYPNVAWQDGTQVGIAEMHDIASGGRFNSSTAQSGDGSILGEFENRQRWQLPTRQDLEQTTFNLNYELTDNLSFKYLFGQTEVLNSNFVDFGGAEFNFFLDYNLNRTELDSHEIQFNGDVNRIHWSAGAYSWEQKGRNRGYDYAAAEWVQTPNQGVPKTLDYSVVLASPACQATAASKGLDFQGRVRFNGSIVGPANGPNSWVIPCNGYFGNGILDAQSIFLRSGNDGTQTGQEGDAYFGEITVDLSDRWDITFGARHHNQENTSYTVDVNAAIAAGLAEAAPLILGDEYSNYDWALGGNVRTTGAGSLQDPASRTSFDNTSYRFGTSFDVRDDLMFYFGYNEGFNSGGTSRFVDSAGGVRVNNYAPEIIESYEVGMRGDFLDNRLRLNATLFSTDWIGVQIQAQAIDPITGSVLTSVTTQNAADGKAEGVDLELIYRPTESLTLGANIGILDTGYTRVQGGLTEAYNLDTAFAGAPDETYEFSVTHDWGLRNGASLVTRVGYGYTGFYERSSLLSFRQKSIVPQRDPEGGDFWMLNLRAAYRPADARYEISLFGNNLTNEYNLNSGFMHRFWNFDFGTVDLPREVGLNVKMNF